MPIAGIPRTTIVDRDTGSDTIQMDTGTGIIQDAGRGTTAITTTTTIMALHPHPLLRHPMTSAIIEDITKDTGHNNVKRS